MTQTIWSQWKNWSARLRGPWWMSRQPWKWRAVGREENTVLKLRVAPQDVGKVIGKQGRTARSVRTILGAVSMKLHHRYTLDILEEDEA